jgi:hypothetical protein
VDSLAGVLQGQQQQQAAGARRGGRRTPAATSTHTQERRTLAGPTIPLKAPATATLALTTTGPECEGTCLAGKCQLDKARPGCCHLARGGRGSYGGQGYAAAAGAGGAEGSVAAGVVAAGGDTSSSVAAASQYKGEGDDGLVCWDGEGAV